MTRRIRRDHSNEDLDRIYGGPFPFEATYHYLRKIEHEKIDREIAKRKRKKPVENAGTRMYKSRSRSYPRNPGRRAPKR